MIGCCEFHVGNTQSESLLLPIVAGLSGIATGIAWTLGLRQYGKKYHGLFLSYNKYRDELKKIKES